MPWMLLSILCMELYGFMNDVDEHPVLWMHLCGFGCDRSNYVIIKEGDVLYNNE